ncbi:MAG: ribonuclease H family protein [Fusobacteriaceae bacterium]|nr:ribonuclease H family protein [Fusobacteriaceae bacterium]
MGKLYAYFLEGENKTGMTDSWEECKKIVAGKKARYKAFPSAEDCRAWLEAGAPYEKKADKKIKAANLAPGIYFDAGTGRGQGVEVRVTDRSGASLIKENFHAFPKNEFDNIFLGKERTNNFGELLGLAMALSFAKATGDKFIFGDSELVIKYWSKGFYRGERLDEDTVKLIRWVAGEREKFEKRGGKLSHITGDLNPADLGFHK